MSPVFIVLAVATIVGAVAAMAMRNLVHCALALTIAFAGLAGIYLQLGAQFVGFAQLLVYVGAVAILIVFAILLTRGSEAPSRSVLTSRWWVGAGVAAAVLGLLVGVVFSSHRLPGEPGAAPETGVRQIGAELMTHYILPLEVLGLMLTVALIGAVIIAMNERPPAATAATQPTLPANQ